MALRPEEVLRLKFQLGVSVTLLGAEPYITYLAVFDKAIQPYIIDPATTSTTVVTASTTAPITVATIPVIAGTTTPAFVPGTTVIVDTGPASESVQITNVIGNVVWGTFANAHGIVGAYPVVMSGGEQIVREILQRIAVIESLLTGVAPAAGGVQEANEAKLYPASTAGSRRGSRDMFESLIQQRSVARDELGQAVGFPNLRSLRRAAGGRVELY